MLSGKKWQWYIEKKTDTDYIMHSISESIYFGKTKFQDVGIIKNPVYGKMLILDGDTQSSQTDEFIYHECLVHPAMICSKKSEKILVLGGGEGATLREILKHKYVKEAVMVDIDKELVLLCEKHLPEWSDGAFKNPKTKLVFQDARKYLTESKKKYDVIISDLTEPFPGSPSCSLFTEEFFEIIKAHLNLDGVFVLQASKGDFQLLNLHTIIYKTLKNVFKTARSFSAQVPSFGAAWAFVICSDKIDPLKLTPKEIDNLISQRIKGKLKFYDGETHQHIFSLPKWYKEALNK